MLPKPIVERSRTASTSEMTPGFGVPPATKVTKRMLASYTATWNAARERETQIARIIEVGYALDTIGRRDVYECGRPAIVRGIPGRFGRAANDSPARHSSFSDGERE